MATVGPPEAQEGPATTGPGAGTRGAADIRWGIALAAGQLAASAALLAFVWEASARLAIPYFDRGLGAPWWLSPLLPLGILLVGLAVVPVAAYRKGRPGIASAFLASIGAAFLIFIVGCYVFFWFFFDL